MDNWYSKEIASFEDCHGIDLSGVTACTDKIQLQSAWASDPCGGEIVEETVYHADFFRIQGDGFAISGKLGLPFRRECNGFEDTFADDVKGRIREVCGPVNYDLLEETADLTPTPPRIPATFTNAAAILTGLGLPVSVRRN